jgi:hypothetical protein
MITSMVLNNRNIYLSNIITLLFRKITKSLYFIDSFNSKTKLKRCLKNNNFRQTFLTMCLLQV